MYHHPLWLEHVALQLEQFLCPGSGSNQDPAGFIGAADRPDLHRGAVYSPPIFHSFTKVQLCSRLAGLIEECSYALFRKYDTSFFFQPGIETIGWSQLRPVLSNFPGIEILVR